LTEDAVTLKLTMAFPEARLTDFGVLSAILLLESVTTISLVAAVLKDTEHASVVGPVSDWFAHEMSLSAGADTGFDSAVGLSVMTSVSVTSSAFPAIVTFTDFATASVTTLKSAVFAPDSITTAAGTFREALLLVSATDVDFVADALR
jgi:hypothetical protein